MKSKNNARQFVLLLFNMIRKDSIYEKNETEMLILINLFIPTDDDIF